VGMQVKAEHHQEHDHHHQDESWWEKIAVALHIPGYGHSHEVPCQQDAIYNNELGIRTLKRALLLLGITTIIQAGIYFFSGSVALLADTVHNLGDALNSIPLWIAFVLARRLPTKRYTYGFGRAEDIAGLFIVLSIGFSAAYILYEAISKIIDPQPIAFGGWVILAALIGFVGNEVVAVLQIRVGRKIGSEAMITDGKHARVDGITSLAILPAVLGSWLNIPILDPIFGLLIGIAIVFITRDAIVAMWYRLMDAVDPHLLEHAESAIRKNSAVQDIKYLRMRWVGHSLHLESSLYVKSTLDFSQIQLIKTELEQELKNEIVYLSELTLSMVPQNT
ncbi:MAG: cation diffusion facilitator family transporter, partial [Desulfobacterales bacterium]|nr:cation diffusion facilitator family transporter [Desulfobacterales bacterium]